MFIIRYKKVNVKVSGEKSDVCDCCMIRPNPKGLHLHHWRYDYTVKEILRNPELAKLNTSPLCYKCHLVANALRIAEENKQRAEVLAKLRDKVLEASK
jgi:hypothetical protein